MTAHPLAPPTYLVLERNALISADLIQALDSRGPCRVMHFTAPEEVAPGLNGIGSVQAAFLEMRFDEAKDSTLAAELARYGARLVLTLREDVERVVNEGWQLLLRPFTEQMVHDALGQR